MAFLTAFLTDFRVVLAARVVLEMIEVCEAEEGNERAGEEEREAVRLSMVTA
jgi:hypothetical protein